MELIIAVRLFKREDINGWIKYPLTKGLFLVPGGSLRAIRGCLRGEPEVTLSNKGWSNYRVIMKRVSGISLFLLIKTLTSNMGGI